MNEERSAQSGSGLDDMIVSSRVREQTSFHSTLLVTELTQYV